MPGFARNPGVGARRLIVVIGNEVDSALAGAAVGTSMLVHRHMHTKANALEPHSLRD